MIRTKIAVVLQEAVERCKKLSTKEKKNGLLGGGGGGGER